MTVPHTPETMNAYSTTVSTAREALAVLTPWSQALSGIDVSLDVEVALDDDGIAVVVTGLPYIADSTHHFAFPVEFENVVDSVQDEADEFAQARLDFRHARTLMTETMAATRPDADVSVPILVLKRIVNVHHQLRGYQAAVIDLDGNRVFPDSGWASEDRDDVMEVRLDGHVICRDWQVDEEGLPSYAFFAEDGAVVVDLAGAPYDILVDDLALS